MACTVAVDVGNTAVKLGVRQNNAIRDHSIVIDATNWQLAAIDWVRDRLGCQDMQWRFASVHRSAAQTLLEAIGHAAPQATIHLISFADVPMAVAVDHPDRLGIDRLLSAYAAFCLFNGPLVVVDAGSAVTVDWVDPAGAFCGGAILPGLNLQARALATGTDALPQIDWSQTHKLQVPAKNTADAIYAGILGGVASAIDGLIVRYLESFRGHPSDVHVVLTGGDSAALSPHVRRPHHHQPNLVCRGLLDLPVH